MEGIALELVARSILLSGVVRVVGGVQGLGGLEGNIYSLPTIVRATENSLWFHLCADWHMNSVGQQTVEKEMPVADPIL